MSKHIMAQEAKKKPTITNAHCAPASKGEATGDWIRNYACYAINESQTSTEVGRTFETTVTKEYKGGLEDVSSSGSESKMDRKISFI